MVQARYFLKRIWTMTYRLSHIALAALTTFGTCTAMAQVTAVAAMEGDLQSSRVAVNVRGVPTGAEGYKLWLAVLHNSQLYFHGEAGFVLFQCPGFCDAPAYQAVVADPQLVAVRNLDARGLIGAKVYLGWGRSFAEMVDSGQIREVLTVAAPSTDPLSLAYSGIYNCRATYANTYLSYGQDIKGPDWSAKIDVMPTGAAIDVSGAKDRSGLSFGARWWIAGPKTPLFTLPPGRADRPDTPAGASRYDYQEGDFYAAAVFVPAGGPDAPGSSARMLLGFSRNWLASYSESCDKI
ncbi:hypothetical protein ASE28_08635 [Acidovorax sp. Root219]|nr:hypothetical protein ASE28_08635 [Acidovorax sp. Root219]